MLIESESFEIPKDLDSDREKVEKEIIEKLKLYHQTSKEKWQQMQKVGSILSEKELLKRGLINEEQLNDFETTSTGDMDRAEGRDNYVFASHNPLGYGNVTLEIDLDALNMPEAKVSTAGEYLMHLDDEEDKNYYNKSLIPASEFIPYLVDFLPTLQNKEWFWKRKGENPEVVQFLGEALLDKNIKGDKTKFREFWKLYPEIMFSKELPLNYIKKVIIDGVEQKIEN